MMEPALPKVMPRGTFRMLGVSSDTYPPWRVDVAVLFGEELARRGHRIDWILQSEDACSSAYVATWGGGSVWVGPTDLGTSRMRRVRKHCLGILHDMKLFSRLGSGDYDFITVKDKFIAGGFAALAARWFRKRFVYWLSYPFPEASLLGARDGTARYPILYWIRGGIFSFLLYRIILPAADHIFVQSEQMRRDINGKGIPLTKMTAVPMGIRLASFVIPEPPERYVIPAGERSILYLGTLTRARRLAFLVQVLAAVKQELPDVKLYVVGSGDDPRDEQEVIAEAIRLGVKESLVMVGRLPQQAALRYVLDADVCLSPFFPTPILNSTSPTKLIEYMAMGKAVVANDHPEQRLVIEQSGGGFCVPYDADAFAGAVLSLLRSPELARTMGERGRQYATAHRDYGSIADAVERELLSVAQRRRETAR
jgi:glycosyltransferase involved in cell wall biosynthesis